MFPSTWYCTTKKKIIFKTGALLPPDEMLNPSIKVVALKRGTQPGQYTWVKVPKSETVVFLLAKFSGIIADLNNLVPSKWTSRYFKGIIIVLMKTRRQHVENKIPKWSISQQLSHTINQEKIIGSERFTKSISRI